MRQYKRLPITGKPIPAPPWPVQAPTPPGTPVKGNRVSPTPASGTSTGISPGVSITGNSNHTSTGKPGISSSNGSYYNVTVDQTDEYFDAVWETIKSLDVNVPDSYSGYMGCNGNHVQMILEAIKKVRTQKAYNAAMKVVGP